MLDPNKRAAIELAAGRAVATMLDYRAAIESGSAAEIGDARMEVGALLQIVRHVAGEEVFRMAVPPVSLDSHRSDQLAALRSALCTAINLSLGSREDGVADPFVMMADELDAIANGDAPSLFARLPGRKTKYRAAHSKLNALCWDQFLEGAGVSRSDRHAAISNAFAQEWDTISRWRGDVQAVLSEAYVDRELRISRKRGLRARGAWLNENSATWRTMLRKDGLGLRLAQVASSGS